MKRQLRVVMFIAAAASVVAAGARIDVTGTWSGEVKGEDGGTGQVRVVLRQEGERVSGTAGPLDKRNPGHIYDAKLAGHHLTFAADDTDDSGLTMTYRFDLRVANDRMQGEAHGHSGDRSWTLFLTLTRER